MMASPSPSVTIPPPSSSSSVIWLPVALSLLVILVIITAAAVLTIVFVCIVRHRGSQSLTQGPRPSSTLSVPILPRSVQFHAGPDVVVQSPNSRLSSPQCSDHDHARDDDIYLGSVISGASGISGLSEDDTLSCPPSPAVSSLCQGESDATVRIPLEPGPRRELGGAKNPSMMSYLGHFETRSVTEISEPPHDHYHSLPTHSPSSLGLTNLFQMNEGSDNGSHHSHASDLLTPVLGKPEPSSTAYHNLNHPTTSEYHSDYYSDYHSHSEHRSSQYGGTRTDRSDYYSDYRSGRHKLHHREQPKTHVHSFDKPTSSNEETTAPMMGFGTQNLYQNEPLEKTTEDEEHFVDSIMLEAIIGYLVHQDNCTIVRCPCKKMKKRFKHLMPLAHLHTRRAQLLPLPLGKQPTSFLRIQASPREHKGDSVVKATHSQSQLMCMTCGTPDYITLTSTLCQCSSKRLVYIDEANDFSLEIPEGAISEGTFLKVDIGVALHGPFQFPAGLRPVSPIFWVCVRDKPDYQFSQPVRITIPHFLNLSSIHDIQSLGLTFLKADHQMDSQHMYQFKPTEGEMKFEPLMKYGVLKTTHFCSLCIACRDTPECLEKTTFCITALLPNAAIPVGKKLDGYFFITFLNLQTCLIKVDELVAKIQERESYERIVQSFDFHTKTQQDPALEVTITQPRQGKIGLKGNRRIHRSEVDFFTRKRISEEELQFRECKDLYPPRFRVFLSCSHRDATLSDAKIAFIGATNDPEFDIFLEAPDCDELSAQPSCVEMSGNTATNTATNLLCSTDLFQVKSKLIEVVARWRAMGLALGLNQGQLDSIQINNRTAEECLTAVATEWLNRAYNTTEYGEPTLQRLCEAVRNRAGGNNPALAERIINSWKVETLC